MAFPFTLLGPNVSASTNVAPTPPAIESFFSPTQELQTPWLPPTQPSKEGILEYSPTFRKAALNTWLNSGAGTRPEEAGFYALRNGQTSPTTLWLKGGNLKLGGSQTYPPDALALFHTHPNSGTIDPSPGDIASASSSKKTIYVQSRGGLYAVDPGGQVTHVFSDPSWMTSKNPQ